jgi:hypothetical protein
MRRTFLFLSLLAVALGLCLRTPAQTRIGATPPWLKFLGNGQNGAKVCPSGTCFVTDEYWYSSFTVAAGATVYSQSGNGPLIIRSTGPCTIAGTVGNTPQIGGSLGINVYGDFGGGGGGGGGGATVSGHSGFWTVGNGWVEIANGGHPGVAPAGTGGAGETVKPPQYRPLLSAGSFWPAGGSPGGKGGGPGGGAGGNAGGPIILVCDSINFTGTIDARGGTGAPPTANNSGAGGGGGGGYVILSANSYTANSGTILTTGGPGGSCSGFTGCGQGGPGGNGWNVAITIE